MALTGLFIVLVSISVIPCYLLFTNLEEIPRSQECLRQTPEGICKWCNIDFYRYNDICYRCSYGCTECHSIYGCKTCQEGYYEVGTLSQPDQNKDSKDDDKKTKKSLYLRTYRVLSELTDNLRNAVFLSGQSSRSKNEEQNLWAESLEAELSSTPTGGNGSNDHAKATAKGKKCHWYGYMIVMLEAGCFVTISAIIYLYSLCKVTARKAHLRGQNVQEKAEQELEFYLSGDRAYNLRKKDDLEKEDTKELRLDRNISRDFEETISDSQEDSSSMESSKKSLKSKSPYGGFKEQRTGHPLNNMTMEEDNLSMNSKQAPSLSNL